MANNKSLTLKDLFNKLPGAISGWEKTNRGVIYDRTNLFEYINGGAELFISYDFKDMIAVSYTKEGFPEIKIDVFDMGNSANAFGIFCHSHETVDGFVGPEVESEYASGLLTFWKGKYYISILTYPETKEKKAIVKRIAQIFSELIREESKKPPLISRLPSENLLADSIRYFRNHVWLNSYYFVSNDNILNINNKTEAALARYTFAGHETNPIIVLLVSYPNPQEAKTAYSSFINHYLVDDDGFKQLESGNWIGSLIKGRLLAVVFNSSAQQQAMGLLNKINFK